MGRDREALTSRAAWTDRLVDPCVPRTGCEEPTTITRDEGSDSAEMMPVAAWTDNIGIPVFHGLAVPMKSKRMSN